MKDKPLIGAILTTVLIYLLISFAVWDLNAKHWDMEARVLYVIFGPMIAGIVYAGIKIE
tara:strand:+ start:476 stop:652 length:177 start_codon:yes stop_codon:yes gene_type:complete